MQKLNKVLPKVLSTELVTAVNAQQALRRWEDAVGPMLAQKSRPDRFDKGVVWVAVEGSAWAQELRLMKEMIIKRLNSMCTEKDAFRDVRFGVRPLPKAETEENIEPSSPMTTEALSIREIAERRLKQWRD